MNKEKYMDNPCGTCAIPFWKQKIVSIPEHMKVIHDRDFDVRDLETYHETKYFRLLNDLKEVDEKALINTEYLLRRVELNIEKALVVDIINACYTDLSVDIQKVTSWMEDSTFDQNLWIFVVEQSSGKAIGLGIANYDNEVKEGSLEWIQVLPQYRGKGIGKLVVNRLLCELQYKALFVTVSGQIDNSTNPERLYRRCGFVGDDIWHVLCKKEPVRKRIKG